MYHPYKNGYSVLPKLSPFGTDFGNGEMDRKYYQIDDMWEEYQQAKLSAKENGQRGYFDTGISDRTYNVIFNFMKNKLEDEYPCRFKPRTLEEVGFCIQEDFAIHEENDRMSLCHMYLPNGWSPTDKINRTFAEIHEPVAGMNFNASRNLVNLIVNKGPYVRFVWGLLFEDRLNCHPITPKKQFNLHDPKVVVSVERQVLVSFPEIAASLFSIRQYRLRVPEDVCVPTLITGLNTMTEATKKYKMFNEYYDQILIYLHSLCS